MTDISNTAWSTTDASNTAANPDGWPSGMPANQVRPTAQQMMGATKRWWERAGPAITTTGSAGAYVYTPSNISYPTAYVDGDVYAAKLNFTSVGSDTFNVNGLGAKGIYKASASGSTAIAAADLYSGQVVLLGYDSALNSGAGGFHVMAAYAAPVVTWPTVLASGNLNTGSATILTLDLSSYSAYKSIELRLDGMTASSGGNILLLVSNDGGSSYITTATYRYFLQTGTGSSVTGTTYTGRTSAFVGDVGNSANNYSPFTTIRMQDAVGATSKRFTYTASCLSTIASASLAPTSYTATGDCSTTGVNAIKLTSSILTSGTYVLVGYP